MTKKQEQIKNYFYSRQQPLLVLIFLEFLSFVLREIPFLNLFLPQNTPLIIISLGLVVLFNLYRNFIFWSILTFLMFFLYLFQFIPQAEVLANFTFAVLSILIMIEIINFFRNLK